MATNKATQLSLTEQEVERFLSMMPSGDLDKCWEWPHVRFDTGYGAFRIGPDRRMVRGAHRASFTIFKGPIPDGLLVLHKCDNPPCVNPAHLFAGTHADNADDRNTKGRTAHGPEHAARVKATTPRGDDNPARKNPEQMPHGCGHGMSKFTEQDVCDIREAFSAGCTRRALSEQYRVCYETISRLLRGFSKY